MARSKQIKDVKSIGRQLRAAREDQGYNLAILANKLELSVVQLVAIEDGNIHRFNKSMEMLLSFACIYAQELGVEMDALPIRDIDNSKISYDENVEIVIPSFLKKRN